MADAGEAKVGDRGQMNLPARIRHRWGLDEGGTVGWVDLGDAVLLFPVGLAEVRNEVLIAAAWGEACSGFGDPELANQ
jgi:AbrB family looped-hinge helix DNA binding protein